MSASECVMAHRHARTGIARAHLNKPCVLCSVFRKTMKTTVSLCDGASLEGGRTRVEGAAHSMGMVRRQVIRSLESARVEMAGKWDVIAALGGSTLF